MSGEPVTQIQLVEVISSINNVAIKLDHFTEVIEKGQVDIINKQEKFDDRLRHVENQMPLIEEMRNHNRDTKRAIYGVIGTIVAAAIVGGLLYANSGAVG